MTQIQILTEVLKEQFINIASIIRIIGTGIIAYYVYEETGLITLIFVILVAISFETNYILHRMHLKAFKNIIEIIK